LERTHINVLYVEKPLLKALILKNLRELILERTHINALYVEKPLLRALAFEDMRELTLNVVKEHGRAFSHSSNL